MIAANGHNFSCKARPDSVKGLAKNEPFAGKICDTPGHFSGVIHPFLVRET